VEAHRVLRRRGSDIFYTISSQMAVKVSALSADSPLSPGRFLVIISVRGWVDPRAIVRLEGLGQVKNPMTSSEIEPATFLLTAKCLNKASACLLLNQAQVQFYLTKFQRSSVLFQWMSMVFIQSPNMWLLSTQPHSYNWVSFAYSWDLRPVVLRTLSIIAYPETRLKERIYVLSAFLLSHLFTAKFSLPYVNTGTITIDLESQFSFVLAYPLGDEFAIVDKARGDLLRYQQVARRNM
jgi:hypothetical protein